MKFLLVLAHLSVLSASVLGATVAPSRRPLRAVQKYAGVRAKGYLVKLNDDASRTDILKEIKLIGSDAGRRNRLANLQRLLRTNAPWGLGRTSSSSANTFLAGSTSALNYTYIHDSSAGTGVDVYAEHEQFGGRVRWGPSYIGTHGVDVDGHGTHCAGTIASHQFGIAKNASIIAVKVLDDQGVGTISGFVSGLDWILKTARSSGNPSIVATSLGAGSSTPLKKAVESLTDAGIHVVASAGNSRKDAYGSMPANIPSLVTVGATAIDDSRAWFSNFGSVVDIWAPGEEVLSTFIGSPNSTKSLDGTSMASPNVSGAIAYLISLEGNVSPKEMSDKLKRLCIPNVITGIPSGTTNCLLHLP